MALENLEQHAKDKIMIKLPYSLGVVTENRICSIPPSQMQTLTCWKHAKQFFGFLQDYAFVEA